MTADTLQPDGTSVPLPPAVAVVVARQGRLPTGAEDAADEAGGTAVLIGSGTEEGAPALSAASRVLRCETGDAFRPADLAALLGPLLSPVPLVILPASADGRDLAPRLAAQLGRPLLAGAERVGLADAGSPDGLRIVAALSRLDDRVLVDVVANGPAVATILPRRRDLAVAAADRPASVEVVELEAARHTGGGPAVGPPPDPELVALLAPDLATLDLADARTVVAGGAGLAVGLDDAEARSTFALLGRVANALGGAAGATRVATDAGWTPYERQIGTTGVAIDPDLYVALGISGAAQHVGGLGSPRHVVSVNVDGASPMTAMADLGLVTDARGLLAELAARLGVSESTSVAVPATRREEVVGNG